MGKAILNPANIPVSMDGETVINRPLEVLGKSWSVTCLSMGNRCV